MPAFWITINPSDSQNPLVLRLAGITYSGDALSTATAAIRQATATSNPVAVAEFFHHTCKAVFEGLLGTNTGRVGILGEVSNHFGVVETNGRGMLHLHGLVWLTGNVAFRRLRERLLDDRPFAVRVPGRNVVYQRHVNEAQRAKGRASDLYHQYPSEQTSPEGQKSLGLEARPPTESTTKWTQWTVVDLDPCLI